MGAQQSSPADMKQAESEPGGRVEGNDDEAQSVKAHAIDCCSIASSYQSLSDLDDFLKPGESALTRWSRPNTAADSDIMHNPIFEGDEQQELPPVEEERDLAPAGSGVIRPAVAATAADRPTDAAAEPERPAASHGPDEPVAEAAEALAASGSGSASTLKSVTAAAKDTAAVAAAAVAAAAVSASTATKDAAAPEPATPPPLAGRSAAASPPVTPASEEITAVDVPAASRKPQATPAAGATTAAAAAGITVHELTAPTAEVETEFGDAPEAPARPPSPPMAGEAVLTLSAKPKSLMQEASANAATAAAASEEAPSQDEAANSKAVAEVADAAMAEPAAAVEPVEPAGVVAAEVSAGSAADPDAVTSAPSASSRAMDTGAIAASGHAGCAGVEDSPCGSPPAAPDAANAGEKAAAAGKLFASPAADAANATAPVSATELSDSGISDLPAALGVSAPPPSKAPITVAPLATSATSEIAYAAATLAPPAAEDVHALRGSPDTLAPQPEPDTVGVPSESAGTPSLVPEGEIAPAAAVVEPGALQVLAAAPIEAPVDVTAVASPVWAAVAAGAVAFEPKALEPKDATTAAIEQVEEAVLEVRDAKAVAGDAVRGLAAITETAKEMPPVASGGPLGDAIGVKILPAEAIRGVEKDEAEGKDAIAALVAAALHRVVAAAEDAESSAVSAVVKSVIAAPLAAAPADDASGAAVTVAAAPAPPTLQAADRLKSHRVLDVDQMYFSEEEEQEDGASGPRKVPLASSRAGTVDTVVYSPGGAGDGGHGECVRDAASASTAAPAVAVVAGAAAKSLLVDAADVGTVVADAKARATEAPVGGAAVAAAVSSMKKVNGVVSGAASCSNARAASEAPSTPVGTFAESKVVSVPYGMSKPDQTARAPVTTLANGKRAMAPATAAAKPDEAKGPAGPKKGLLSCFACFGSH